jgi:hypothetical protein
VMRTCRLLMLFGARLVQSWTTWSSYLQQARIAVQKMNYDTLPWTYA